MSTESCTSAIKPGFLFHSELFRLGLKNNIFNYGKVHCCNAAANTNTKTCLVLQSSVLIFEHLTFGIVWPLDTNPRIGNNKGLLFLMAYVLNICCK